MKIKDVPQDDDGFLQEGKVRDLCYAIDEDGNYKQVLSIGWNPKNEAMKLALQLVDEQVENTKQAVIEGKLSPLAYYMEKNMMDVKLLSQYTGIPKRKIRKHLNPNVFFKLKPSLIEQYAKIFNLSIQDLLNIESVKISKPFNEE
ncbi:MAG: hypothetical protein AUJ97_00535 [Bacteroidetes bacterium CG2_30_32_10]|nr:MAG: hypothetical protein AUJ97_00535 [Bacteroidetes bacterium CG2_30_32_10]